MVPHHHHSETEDLEHHEEIEEATSPIDFLVLMFHKDLGGDNHLEDYNVSSNIQLTFPLFCVLPSIFNFEFLILNNSKYLPPVYSESTLDSELRPSRKKRGPPSYFV